MNKLTNFFQCLFINILDFLEGAWEIFLDYFSLWLFIGTCSFFSYCIFNLGVNEYKKNYIIYAETSLTKDKINCDNHICVINTTVGKMTVGNISRDIDDFKDMKFDVGIKLGTCKHELYAKIHTNDLIRPYVFVDLDEYSRGTDQYKFYTEKYKANLGECE